jgi:hypothetical protein
MQRLCALLLLGSLSPIACGTDATGINQCRDIEYARCEAAVPCGLVEDLDACQRFARDNCLHGTAGDTPPTSIEVRDCTRMLDDARECAADDPEMDTTDCGIDLARRGSSRAVCDIVLEPERTEACFFLLVEPEDEDEDEEMDADGGAD